MIQGRIASRLAELGMTLPPVPVPIAAYVPAVRQGYLIWTSGQLPFVDGKLQVTGKVGEGPGLVTPDEGREAARVCVLNALAAAQAAVRDLDRVRRVLKVVGYVASDPSFTGQPHVVDGASQLLNQVFEDQGSHVRSAVGVSVLPLDAPVELELIMALS